MLPAELSTLNLLVIVRLNLSHFDKTLPIDKKWTAS